MRKVDESRAANYIRKHSNYKKWLAFVLCLSLLTGTVTLYILNKPATAMTAEGAEGLGVVLETASDADEQVLIQQTLENKSVSNDNGDDDLFAGLNEDGDDNDENAGGNGDGDDLNKSGDDEETKDGLVEKEVTEGEAKEGEEAKETEESESKEEELTQDVVLTVSYVDEDGNSIADEKEIDIYDSIDLTSEAPSIEGYTFKEATFKGDVITKVEVKKNADDIRYYEVTFDDDETKEIKKDAAVVLTYIKDEEEVEVDASVTLTAKYVDKDGEDIQDSEEISFAKETSINKDNAPEIDGYFFMKAVYDGQEIVKITPVEAEAEVEAEDSDNEEETTEETEEAKTVSVEGYEFTTADGETVEITEDAEIEYTYVKASEETEFTYQDGKVTVTATINGKNVFPEGIVLKAAEVTKDSSSYNYGAYMDALNENAETIAEEAGQEQANAFTEDNTLLYDIAFVYEGKEIQPKEGTVTISINFKKNQLSEDLSAASKDDVTVVHLPIKEDVKEENEIVNTEDASDITASDIEVITLTDATAAVDGNEKVEFETEGFSIFAVTAYQKLPVGTHTYEDVLGDAVNFGIVTNEIELHESQTNFVTKKLVASGGQSGNDLTNPMEQTYIVSRITGGKFKIKGNLAYFITPSEYTEYIENRNETDRVKFDTSYSSERLDEISDDMLKYVRDASADLASYVDKSPESILKGLEERDGRFIFIDAEKSNDKYAIDIRGEEDNKTVYVTLNDKDIERIAEANKLTIFKKRNQTIVFNVTAVGPIKLYNYRIVFEDNSMVHSNDKDVLTPETRTVNSDIAKTVIWNFINAKDVETKGSTVGVFISGQKDATFTNGTTCAGWLAFPHTIIGAQEWHNTYDKIKKISGTAQFEAYKAIDDRFADVSGFKFTLYKKESDNSWTELETVSNDKDAPVNVHFSTITYGDNDKLVKSDYQYVSDDTPSFTYKIVETLGYTDENGNSYTADKAEFYADVTVTKHSYNGSQSNYFYAVSEPSYYTLDSAGNKKALEQEIFDGDGNKVVVSDRPVFNNRTGGSVGFNLFKYVNEKNPETKKFQFKVEVLKPINGNSDKGQLKDLTANQVLENIGKDISFNSEYSNNWKDDNGYVFNNNCIYFVVTEKDVSDNNIVKDKDYIIVKCNIKTNETSYYKYDYEDESTNGDKWYIDGIPEHLNMNDFEWLCNDAHKINDPLKRAFYNTGKTLLRIHKMVVNDFDTKTVGEADTAILNNVVFRITNEQNHNYVDFQGFKTGERERYKAGRAVEYYSNGIATGKRYDVVYNQKAQWTVIGLPEGTYTVEEISDGYTFHKYDASKDASLSAEHPYSRVTMYGVTIDEEYPGSKDHGVGGSNARIVFSADLDEHSVDPPQGVEVGGAIRTVQVCNNYSRPLGPIQVTKNFFGGLWNDKLSFEFVIEGSGFTAQDSAGNDVTSKVGVQPMPDITTVSINGDGATLNSDGSYSKIAEFGPILYRYKGTYKYKITEKNTGAAGVAYDDKVIYVKVDVSDQETRFTKMYSNEANGGILNPKYYNASEGAKRDDELFNYLGADITYSTDETFTDESKVLARCKLRQAINPNTKDILGMAYDVEYTLNEVSDVAFNNKRFAKLAIRKEWDSIDGSSAVSTRPLRVQILYRTNGGEWKEYKTVELPQSTWSWSEQDLPNGETLPYMDATGNVYEYCVREPENEWKDYAISYKYTDANNNTISRIVGQYEAGESETMSFITKDGKKVEAANTGYSMKVVGSGNDYGTVLITNTKVVSNSLPSTGGVGDIPYLATGAGAAVAALLGAGVYSRKKKKDDEE